jgi:anthranilate 1,2-dioxygenase small subunit
VNTDELKLATEDLFAAYAHCLDDDRIEEWPSFFTDSGSYKIIGRDNVEQNLPIATMLCASKAMMTDRVVAIRNASVYSQRYLRHVVSGIRVVSREENAYSVVACFVVFQTLQDEGTKVFMAGKYAGTVVLVDGAAKFQELTAIYDSVQIPGLLVIPL